MLSLAQLGCGAECSGSALHHNPGATSRPLTPWVTITKTLVTLMSLLFPSFHGQIQITSSGAVFLEAMKARVQSGLLMGKPHWRSRYAVTRHTQQELSFRASDIMTAINVGLNEVTLRSAGNRCVEYSVTT